MLPLSEWLCWRRRGSPGWEAALPRSVRSRLARSENLHWIFDHFGSRFDRRGIARTRRRTSACCAPRPFREDGKVAVPRRPEARPHPADLRFHRENILKGDLAVAVAGARVHLAPELSLACSTVLIGESERPQIDGRATAVCRISGEGAEPAKNSLAPDMPIDGFRLRIDSFDAARRDSVGEEDSLEESPAGTWRDEAVDDSAPAAARRRRLLPCLVPLAGLEPARCFHHLILSQARLPIPPQGLMLRDHTGHAGTVNANR
jgi:hypothetical protein